jgi:hypothetical protein
MIRADSTKLMSFWHYRKIGDNPQRRALTIIFEQILVKK